ncbi:hypothetical protein POTOM_039139 [Populus tomentosa]|uniref:Autophagy-related protein n=1 Tax=Populus tomentosa TaxID=118781 RepID=A0A8X8CIJ7_POPTO|nr:hypothetical protein POTOM_039139 [Populus tomentosa]
MLFFDDMEEINFIMRFEFCDCDCNQLVGFVKNNKMNVTFSFSFLLTCRSYIKLSSLHLKFGLTSERRQAEASRIREKHPDRVPVIVEKAGRSDVPDIDKKKYLVPADLTVGQFVYVVRKRIKLSPEKAIFVFVKNTLPPTATLMSVLYEENKDEDGFLYMTYSGENTFGFH